MIRRQSGKPLLSDGLPCFFDFIAAKAAEGAQSAARNHFPSHGRADSMPARANAAAAQFSPLPRQWTCYFVTPLSVRCKRLTPAARETRIAAQFSSPPQHTRTLPSFIRTHSPATLKRLTRRHKCSLPSHHAPSAANVLPPPLPNLHTSVPHSHPQRNILHAAARSRPAAQTLRRHGGAKKVIRLSVSLQMIRFLL